MSGTPTPFDFAHDQLGHGCFAVDRRGHVHAFVPSVRDALIERGLLYQDGDQVWRFNGDDLDLSQPKLVSLSCCDFCLARPVAWNIPCETFALPSLGDDAPPAKSIGDWAACEPCGDAIAGGQRGQLLARSLAAHGRRRTQRQFQEALHRSFWQHYEGGAVRLPATHPFGH